MKNLFAALLASAALGLAVPALADPSGSYIIRGTNPDGSSYAGSVLVAKLGDTYTITYTLSDDTEVSGTAIGDDDVLSIGYGGDDNVGVALMYREGDKWQGVWAYLGSKSLGTEEWHPR